MLISEPRCDAYAKDTRAKSAARRKPPSKRERSINPVLESAGFVHEAIDLVQINDEGVKSAARYIKTRLLTDAYTPRTWRTHPLHICPVDSVEITDPRNKLVLDWIFLISSLNFSFWSEEKQENVFGVKWRDAWSSSDASNDAGKGKMQVWTGYWSLVAALDRALADDNIPITDPCFYSDETRCPDSLIEHVFRKADPTREPIALLKERIAIMREVGKKLRDDFNGSFLYLVQSFQKQYNGNGTALDLVKMVVETFPSFRDETWIDGHKVHLWKRAQILVAETWAAFYPPPGSSPPTPHPIFPSGPQIHLLTMFADYRVPQILHHLRILTYPPPLVDLLQQGVMLENGSKEEVSLRVASILAVERVRKEMVRMRRAKEKEARNGRKSNGRKGRRGDDEAVGSDEDNVDNDISSVLIDFYLWDLAKRIEDGTDEVKGIETAEMLPMHRTRSIWY
ncbi:hypothetical protein AX14_006140 [Amanita brunnescens Koide BX004]|nr:hypothetical protein AX14_006140 [Amanita brunnescens Koide BX004]